jgi:hypothetical protein
VSRRTVLVEGPLAFRMRRFGAAERGEHGLQILTLPLLAARLAGGFYRPALAEDLEPAITEALSAGGFAEIDSMCALPGMTRATERTLNDLWSADLDVAAQAHRHLRLADLARIEDRVRQGLPPAVLPPRELRALALRGVQYASATLGPVELDPCLNVAPVWRPLLRALSECAPLSWHEPATRDVDWFPGRLLARPESAASPAPEAVSCADPRAEVVEALRWARELIASGKARPEDIAICAPAPDTWDEHFVTLAQDAMFPIHFSAGSPALATREGQACAALASVLLHGLSQERIRRLIGLVATQSSALASLPTDWARGLRREAALFHLRDWRHALDAAVVRIEDGPDSRPTLLPVLELLSGGTSVATRAGELFLGNAARTLWQRALRGSPAHALEFSLRALRVSDGRDPAVCIVWCPTTHLIGAARPWVRLLGLNSGTWPRRASEDPLLPNHILAKTSLDPDPITQRDRRAFHFLLAHASRGAVLSFSRSDSQGRRLPASPLVTLDNVRALARGRRPEHAFSEADRLLARPADAAGSARLKSALICWQNWHRPSVTAHDGRIRAGHPLMKRAITRVQSATSLRLMLRDPLAFVWRYALGWRSTVEPEEPLTLSARGFGNLVHELLRRAVDHLEPQPGYGHAAPDQIDGALHVALDEVRAGWPLEHSIPPALLWDHILMRAQRLARRALHFDPNIQEGTRCWTELHFGQPDPCTADGPWDATRTVPIPNTPVRVRGSIDRLDLQIDRHRVRVSDYKTGLAPAGAENMVLRGGEEVQRVIYALAIRELLPEVRQIKARLLFLGSDPASEFALKSIDQAVRALSQHIAAACQLLEEGKGLSGIQQRPRGDEFRLARAAALDLYENTKREAVLETFGRSSDVWNAP